MSLIGGLIGQLRTSTGGIQGLGKVDKIYLDNPNLIYTLGSQNVEIGTVRETFFYNIWLWQHYPSLDVWYAILVHQN